MTGFEPWTSGIVSDHSTNWASHTTTALLLKIIVNIFTSDWMGWGEDVGTTWYIADKMISSLLSLSLSLSLSLYLSVYQYLSLSLLSLSLYLSLSLSREHICTRFCENAFLEKKILSLNYFAQKIRRRLNSSSSLFCSKKMIWTEILFFLKNVHVMRWINQRKRLIIGWPP